MSVAIARQSKPIISNAVFAMSIFVFTEIMFFMALVSAFLVIQKDRGGSWDLAAKIQLPVYVTAVNTLVLFLSGFALFWAGRKAVRNNSSSQTKWILRSAILATVFVLVQGGEWVQLIGHGMTMSSTIFGACFFLLVGSHALHAVVGICALIYGYTSSKSGSMTLEGLRALQVFWFFIVGIWPVLYVLVYF